MEAIEEMPISSDEFEALGKKVFDLICEEFPEPIEPKDMFIAIAALESCKDVLRKVLLKHGINLHRIEKMADS